MNKAIVGDPMEFLQAKQFYQYCVEKEMGMAMATNTPIIATTIKSSASVKPLSDFNFLFINIPFFLCICC